MGIFEISKVEIYCQADERTWQGYGEPGGDPTCREKPRAFRGSRLAPPDANLAENVKAPPGMDGRRSVGVRAGDLSRR